MSHNKRYLVIGGMGFIGRHLSKRLMDDGHDVTVFDNFSLGQSKTDLFVTRVIKGDIRNQDDIDRAMQSTQPDVVIHLAALHYIPYCITHPADTIKTNITGTQHVLHAINSLLEPPLLIFASSASVYGLKEPSEQTESATLSPCDIYGRTKSVGEQLITSQSKKFIIMRLYNAVGSGDSHPHLLPRIQSQLSPSVSVKLGNPDSQRDFIHVNDIVEAFICVIDSNHSNKTYNLGSGTSYSVKDITKMFSKCYPHEVKFAFMRTNGRLHDPSYLKANTDSLRLDTTWRTRHSVDEAIRELVDEVA